MHRLIGCRLYRFIRKRVTREEAHQPDEPSVTLPKVDPRTAYNQMISSMLHHQHPGWPPDEPEQRVVFEEFTPAEIIRVSLMDFND